MPLSWLAAAIFRMYPQGYTARANQAEGGGEQKETCADEKRAMASLGWLLRGGACSSLHRSARTRSWPVGWIPVVRSAAFASTLGESYRECVAQPLIALGLPVSRLSPKALAILRTGAQTLSKDTRLNILCTRV